MVLRAKTRRHRHFEDVGMWWSNQVRGAVLGVFRDSAGMVGERRKENKSLRLGKRK